MPGYQRLEMQRHLSALHRAFREHEHKKLVDAVRTLWYPSGTHPAHVGYYERQYCDGVYLHYWDDKVWRSDKHSAPHWRQVNDYPTWRGLRRAPSTENAPK